LQVVTGVVGALGIGGSRALAHPLGPTLGRSFGPSLEPRRSPQYVDTPDGARLYTRAWGTATTRTVVFVHAWGLTADAWQYQMVPLSTEDMRCIAYDRRGHGRSSDPGSRFDFDTLSDDLAAVLKAHDVRDAVLVGHSLGAGEVVRYMTRHRGERVSKMILVATAPTPFRMRTADNPDGVPQAVLEQLRHTRLLKDLSKTLADAMPQFLAPDSSSAMLGWVIRMVEQTSLKALVECHRSMTETDFRPDLRKLRIPVLLIHGDKDTSAPLETTGRATAAMIQSARLTVYEGAPHGIPLTHAERLTNDIRAFAGA
jgi:non-heme chloroperoxidase